MAPSPKSQAAQIRKSGAGSGMGFPGLNGLGGHAWAPGGFGVDGWFLVGRAPGGAAPPTRLTLRLPRRLLLLQQRL